MAASSVGLIVRKDGVGGSEDGSGIPKLGRNGLSEERREERQGAG